MQQEKKVNCYQVISIAKQVAFALAVAEAAYEFEHRDLHNSNVLIKKTSNKYVIFSLNGKCYQMECCGVMAFIIDNTFSRYKISEYKFISAIFLRSFLISATGIISFWNATEKMNDSRDNPTIRVDK